ncbi:hypothetical protein ACMWD3_06975 [Gardnerella swidsinskii]|uniref:Uncharacterized protein n=1 Tax=Gardnerella swidsinskii TaxID=2792979 RepID=A0ABM6GHL7_9BIFI|nr:hypothetical protein BVL65_00385 [Gardnerella vaginalis]
MSKETQKAVEKFKTILEDNDFIVDSSEENYLNVCMEMNYVYFDLSFSYDDNATLKDLSDAFHDTASEYFQSLEPLTIGDFLEEITYMPGVINDPKNLTLTDVDCIREEFKTVAKLSVLSIMATH